MLKVNIGRVLGTLDRSAECIARVFALSQWPLRYSLPGAAGQRYPRHRQRRRFRSAEYRIGPGDNLNIFVWRNPELTVTVPVRPDGRLSIPLVEDVVAIGKTPSALAREYEQRLAKYVKEPLVTVIVEGFVGPIPDSIRIIGEASQPRALPYRADMTVLDAMIAVGGLTRYAAGNDTVLIRTAQGEQNTYSVHLNNLIRDGDIDSNVALRPGDILIIPQRLF